MKYNFPRIKYADENNSYQQLQHLKSECIEIIERIDSGDFAGIIEEMLDRHHSAETFFRKCEAAGVDIDWAINQIIDKNRARWYYND